MILGSSIFSSGLTTFALKRTSIINSPSSTIQAGIQFVRIKSKRQTAHPCSGAERVTSTHNGYFVHAKALSSNHSSQSRLQMSTGCCYLNSFILSENLHCICKALFPPPSAIQDEAQCKNHFFPLSSKETPSILLNPRI